MAEENGLKGDFGTFGLSLDRLETAGNILTEFTEKDFKLCEGSAVFFDVGEIIKRECARLRENIKER